MESLLEEITLDRDGVEYNLLIEIEGRDYEGPDTSVGISRGQYNWCGIVSCTDENGKDFKLTDAEDNKLCGEYLDYINQNLSDAIDYGEE